MPYAIRWFPMHSSHLHAVSNLHTKRPHARQDRRVGQAGLLCHARPATSRPPRPAAGPLKCASGQPTQIPCAGEGGMGVSVRHRFAMRRRRLRRRQGGQHVCVIGPEGQIMVRPEGSTVDIDGSFVLSSNGLPTSGYCYCSETRGLRLTRTCIQTACQQTGTANSASNMAGD